MRWHLYFFLLCSAAVSAQDVTLHSGEYRYIYQAAELTGQARCCGIDWQEFEQAWLADLENRARLAGWALEKRSYCETLYYDIRQRMEEAACLPCGSGRRDSLLAKIDSTRNALVGNNHNKWPLRPRGQNWISVPPLTRAAPHLIWVAGPKERPRNYANRWLPPDDINEMSNEFLSLRFLAYAEESLEVLALQAGESHEVLRRSVALLQAGDPEAAEEVLIEVEDDSYLNNQYDFWLLRSYIRLRMGDRREARRLAGQLLETPHRDSRQEILGYRVLRELGVFQSENLRSRVLGIVVEIGRDGRVEVLSVFPDGTVNLFYSSGGGVLVQRYSSPGRIYDVQRTGRSLFVDARQMAFMRQNLTTSEPDRQLPRQGQIRLAIITACETLSTEQTIADFNTSFPPIWSYVAYYHRVLTRVYEQAEIDR